ncbi:MAG TPA: hypothetical protein VHT30_00140 [Acidimicrobiales bacterium]|nr:hypothetical protein [Acidimicrobiales bacterium]
MTLLDEPGISPALRSAIFTALADTPGVMTYGLLTDPLGRTGETVGVVVDGIRIVMSFDPATTSLLELQKTVVNPAQLVVPKEPGAVRWPTDTIMSTESFSVPVLVPDANTVPG